MSGVLERQRARLTVGAVLGAYFATVAALGGHADWGRLGVPVETYRFYDMRNVATAWECTRRGLSILPVNPCDPGRRPADFPRIWLAVSFLGLGPANTIALGVGLAVIFLVAAVFVLPAGASVGTGLFYALVLCSPAVMLGVERGNPDLLIFVLVLAAVLAGDRTRTRLVVSAALLLFAALLKFYPVFAVGFLVRRATRASLVAAGAVAACFGVYALAIHSQIHQILSAIPESSLFAYGVRLATHWFAAFAQAKLGGYAWFRPWDLLLIVLGLAAGWLLGRGLRGREAVSPDDAGARRDLDLFWAGACIYLGSYAIFISNDYRLVFLLLTVPQLVRWTSARRVLAYVTLPALLVTLWLDEWLRMPVLVHVMDWWARLTSVGPDARQLTVAVLGQLVLFATLAGWLVATAPAVRVRVSRR